MIKKHITTLLLIFLLTSPSIAAWQDTLEANFDIVDTFDQYDADWTGNISAGGYVYINDVGVSGFPQVGGSRGLWGAYSQFYTGSSDIEEWIGPHSTNHWSGNRSVCINYNPLYCNESSDVKGYGPDRLLGYFGDGNPDSGYDEIYIFTMMSIPDGFFTYSDSTFNYGVVVKAIMVHSGFIDDKFFHCPDDSDIVSNYGYNWYIWDLEAGGSSHPTSIYTPAYHGPQSGDGVCGYTGTSLGNITNSGLEVPYFAGEWFGVQLRWKNNSGAGVSDGEYEVWFYNESGTQIGHGLVTGINNRPYAPLNKFNRIELGGNYQCYSGSEIAYGGDPKLYFDDIIIDDQAIASTYFTLLAEEGDDTTPPTLDAINVQASGLTTQFDFSENMAVGTDGYTNFTTVVLSGGSVTLSGCSITGDIVECTNSRQVLHNETLVSFAYDQPGNGLRDTATTPNNLAPITTYSGSFTNNVPEPGGSTVHTIGNSGPVNAALNTGTVRTITN